VESSRLSNFYRAVTEWPKKSSELRLISEKIRQLVEVPFIAIYIPDLGVQFSGLGTAGDPSPESLETFIRTQADMYSERGSARSLQLKQIQLNRELSFSRDGLTIQNFTTLPIAGEMRPESGSRDIREWKEFGWIFAATPRVLSSKTELLLTAVAQRLGDLAIFDHLDQALSMRDQFLSIASHELKTPLTSIYGILQLQERILRGKKDEPQSPEQEKQRSYLKIVIRQVERLNELIDGLLDVSRIQNGRFMVEPSDTDVSPILQETVTSRLNVIAQEAGVRIHLDTPDQLVAWVDPVRFEEVITNLGMNAIRFSPEGGVVWIKLRSADGGIILSVRDQGPSLPEADRARIFQPFERAQRTGRLGGLGLGLFISRQIAQMHGGTVILSESLPGKGNVFEAIFPARKAESISA